MRKEDIEVIYEDGNILVINKPAGVPVTKDRAGKPQLIDFLVNQLGDEPTARLRLVHRLDKDTSGVMILAKNTAAQRKFADYFFERKIKKTYLALVKGAVLEGQGIIDSPIGQSKKNPDRKMIDPRHGKRSITEWRLLANFGLCSLLAVTPITGRTHQIRVHLASIGLPLALDPFYGGSMPLMLSEFKKDYRLGKFQDEKPLIDRLTLHAYQIVIPESYVIPAQACPCECGAGIRSNCFVAALDRKFKTTIKMLAKHNPLGPAAFINPGDFEAILEALPL